MTSVVRSGTSGFKGMHQVHSQVQLETHQQHSQVSDRVSLSYIDPSSVIIGLPAQYPKIGIRIHAHFPPPATQPRSLDHASVAL
eukprot:6214373-Pleurochrysis_carterae.AAC.5